MDLNLVVIAGRLAAEPELRIFESGATLMRVLITVRSEEPRRRMDVIPVVVWNPDSDHELLSSEPLRGRAVYVAGAVQRRFWSSDDGRQSKLEVVAEDVVLKAMTLEPEPAHSERL